MIVFFVWIGIKLAAAALFSPGNPITKDKEIHSDWSPETFPYSGCTSGEVVVWEVDGQKSKLIQRFPNENELIYSLSFSPNGKYLAAANPKFVKIWSTQVRKAHNKSPFIDRNNSIFHDVQQQFQTWQLISSHEIARNEFFWFNSLSWDSESRKLAQPCSTTVRKFLTSIDEYSHFSFYSDLFQISIFSS